MLLAKSAATFAHKVVQTKKPPIIYEATRIPALRRTCQELSSKINPRTQRQKRGIIYRIPRIFNNLDNDLKLLTVAKFKHRLENMRYQILKLTDFTISMWYGLSIHLTSLYLTMTWTIGMDLTTPKNFPSGK